MREWIVTNGLGGYASLTHTNHVSSKYHGLLITSENPPTQRWVHLSNILTTIQTPTHHYDLSALTAKYSHDIHPTLTYQPDHTLTFQITPFMPHHHNTIVLKIDVQTHQPITISHQPIINSRHIYDTTNHSAYSIKQHYDDNVLTINRSNSEKILQIHVPDSTYRYDESWQHYTYQKDQKRHDNGSDHNLHLGVFSKKISSEHTYYITATIEPDYNHHPDQLYLDCYERRAHLIAETGLPESYKALINATDHFITKKETHGTTIVAGYHWFGDWGRDTLIALPGLTLVTKRYSEAADILKSFAGYIKNGLIPNVFGERDGAASYNTVDASLWYIDRAYQYLKYTNDISLLKTLYPSLESIITGYRDGTDYNIHMDSDYLISHDPGLTWMDVKMGDYYPTPRTHKAVEIQALWYNALRIMAYLAQRLGKDDIYTELSENVKESFNSQYNELYDVLDTKDTAFRCNTIFLVSLDYSMIPKSLQQQIVEQTEEKLVTLFGLRTLSSNHADYKPYYFGDYHRDESYHNGIVWPWPLGSFITAYLKVHNYCQEARNTAKEQFIKPLLDIYGPNWDGNIHEIFDAEPVYEPHGCIAQAWSVSEILRSLIEDIEYIRPPHEKELNSLSQLPSQ